jgi:hypothetical protein
VGAGGVGTGTQGVTGVSGSDSVFSTITSTGGGGGGVYGVGTIGTVGLNGGSGGGGGSPDSGGTVSAAGGSGNTPSTSPSQGNNGGTGTTNNSTYRTGGGGGGATSVGSNGGTTNGGDGGAGTASSISGSSVTYAGGGGGGTNRPSAGGAGGAGGGGTGGVSSGNGSNGTVSLGGGGGGAGGGTGGTGGSGIVIISYVGAQQFGGGVVTSSGGNTIHTFTSSGALSPLSSLTANFLVVAGGGGGGSTGGGGGAGGLLTSSGLTIDTNSIYLVTVGAGGAISGGQGVSGSNSLFSAYATSAVGGGYGGGYGNPTGLSGATGGSGGGGGYCQSSSPSSGGAGTAGQGSAGGTGTVGSAGGGGGAGAVGGNAAGGTAGNGGNGTASSISGTSTTYAGGGGGESESGTAGTGGSGGGGRGGLRSGANAVAGTANLGGGGGGGDGLASAAAGGSGVVIISYPGSTQQMAGGTVTVAGGNVIHTFTSSGYLTPIVLTTNSLRFRSSASAYLNRTPASAGNRQIWTWSGWVKRGLSVQYGGLFTAWSANNAAGYAVIRFDDDQLLYKDWDTVYRQTSQVFRDFSAWYHIVVAIDTTQATASNRVKMYVNGVQVTSFATSNDITQNSNTNVNNTVLHTLGVNYFSSAPQYFTDGYMTEVNFIDGQALTPNSFGTTSDLGVWQPIRYGGSYGTNGFYLKFTDTTNTTTLGYDSSPNSNNWTTNNISLTAGTTYDSMTDVPTLTSATAANYATFNGIGVYTNLTSNLTYSNGNLQVTYNNADVQIGSSIRIPNISGKYYLEFTATYSSSSNGFVGLFIPNGTVTLQQNGVIGNFGVCTITSTTGVGYSSGQIISFAIDADTKTATIRVNNTVNTVIDFSAVPAGVFIDPAVWLRLSGDSFIANYGQQPFTYTPPSGFVGLNTFNLPTPTIGATASTTANKYFDATTYTGTGSSLAVTNSGSMQPDFVWLKNRSSATYHWLTNAITGTSKQLTSNATDAESSYTQILTAFNSNGFTVGTDGDVNANGSSYVGWQWRASNATAVTNTNGSIISTVSANTTAGFSIVTYTGNATSSSTVGHGLGTTPTFFIIKSRGVQVWNVYSLAGGITGNTILQLNDSSGAVTGSNISLTASSTTIGFGSASQVNGSGVNFVAYVFAPVAGYSAFGSYTGNGSSDGPFIFTGFRPRYVMIKRSDSTADWNVRDTARSPYNVVGEALYPNLSFAEYSGSETYLDILSNGFKLRGNWNSSNASGGTYIYMAFAESPLKFSNAR